MLPGTQDANSRCGSLPHEVKTKEGKVVEVEFEMTPNGKNIKKFEIEDEDDDHDDDDDDDDDDEHEHEDTKTTMTRARSRSPS